MNIIKPSDLYFEFIKFDIFILYHKFPVFEESELSKKILKCMGYHDIKLSWYDGPIVEVKTKNNIEISYIYCADSISLQIPDFNLNVNIMYITEHSSYIPSEKYGTGISSSKIDGLIQSSHEYLNFISEFNKLVENYSSKGFEIYVDYYYID